ncbi:MAG: four helix bundle protein [Acidobacteria bacterium]|nr:four helix bundle protein [Acidobacteriota bacterium]
MNESGPIKSHRDLIVWQKAVQLVVVLYDLTKGFPREEIYGLVSQIRRAATSIPANIAEGQGRRLKGEYQHFLGNARGSLWELDTHIEVSFQLAFITEPQYQATRAQMDEIGRMLNGLMRSISDSYLPPPLPLASNI